MKGTEEMSIPVKMLRSEPFASNPRAVSVVLFLLEKAGEDGTVYTSKHEIARGLGFGWNTMLGILEGMERAGMLSVRELPNRRGLVLKFGEGCLDAVRG